MINFKSYLNEILNTKIISRKIFFFLFIINLFISPFIMINEELILSESGNIDFVFEYPKHHGWSVAEFILWIIFFIICLFFIKKKSFFSNIIRDGNLIQKFFLFTLIINLLVTPIMMIGQEFFRENKTKSFILKYNVEYYPRYDQGWTLTEFSLWVVLIVILLFSLFLFQSRPKN